MREVSHSQNFFKDSGFVRNLLDKTDIKAGDLVVEIGPGKGVITRCLADRNCFVVGVEIDDYLYDSLRKLFADNTNVKIVKADFLRWRLPEKPYKVFSNIPFNMTADIVSKLLYGSKPPESAWLIFQDKAAERFVGDPIAKDTQMSILLKPFWEMAVVSKIDRSQFLPTPKVDTALVMFKKRQTPLVEHRFSQLFRDFVVYAYNKWKPTVSQALKKVFSHKQRLILGQKVDIEKTKPRDLKINQWLILFKSFLRHVPQDKKHIVTGAQKRLINQQNKLQKRYRTR